MRCENVPLRLGLPFCESEIEISKKELAKIIEYRNKIVAKNNRMSEGKAQTLERYESRINELYLKIDDLEDTKAYLLRKDKANNQDTTR